MTEHIPKAPTCRGELRVWQDGAGGTWRLWLDQDERYQPGSLLVFAATPAEELASPKVLVRGVPDVFAVPRSKLDFYLAAARAGGFVWRDRDGLPWHFTTELRAVSASAKELRIHHPGSHRPLWVASDRELSALVRQGRCRER
jgi:hypothetical protein